MTASFNERTIITSSLRPTKIYIIDPEKNGFYTVLEIDTLSGEIIRRRCYRISRANGDKKEARPGAKPEYFANLILCSQEGKILHKIERIKEIFEITERLA
jgi:hypothetical protein